MHYGIPLLTTWVLCLLAPGSSPETTNTTPPKHPHHPQAIKIAGVKGNITLTYFTVTYNGEKVKDATKAGFNWHLGFAQLQNDVPLKAGKVDIPVGKWMLNSRVNDDGKTWTLVLMHPEMVRARSVLSRQQRRGTEEGVAKAKEAVHAVEARVKKGEILDNIALPTTAFKADDAEHLEFHAINRGYPTRQMGSTEPRSETGVRATVRVSFGGLHYQFEFSEFVKGVKPPEEGEGRRRRGR